MKENPPFRSDIALNLVLTLCGYRIVIDEIKEKPDLPVIKTEKHKYAIDSIHKKAHKMRL